MFNISLLLESYGMIPVPLRLHCFHDIQETVLIYVFKQVSKGIALFLLYPRLFSDTTILHMFALRLVVLNMQT